MRNWFKKPLKANAANTTAEAADPDAHLKESNKALKDNLSKLDRSTDLKFEGGSSSFDARPRTTEDDVVDKNLETMLAGLTVLKGQGLALGNEIDEQNVLLDTIQGQTENMDKRVEQQNKRINKIIRN